MHAPVFLESPLIVSLGQTHTHTITGPPGAEYEIWGVPIDEAAWLAGSIVDILPAPTSPLFTGSLPIGSTGIVMTSAVRSLTLPYDPDLAGPWRLEVRYRLFGVTPWTILNGESATPGSSPDPIENLWAPFFDVHPAMLVQDLGQADQVPGIAIFSRTGGLNEDLDL